MDKPGDRINHLRQTLIKIAAGGNTSALNAVQQLNSSGEESIILIEPAEQEGAVTITCNGKSRTISDEQLLQEMKGQRVWVVEPDTDGEGGPHYQTSNGKEWVKLGI